MQYYQENFVRVEEAIDILRLFIGGRYHTQQNTSDAYSAPKQESSEEILRRNAPMMQTTLREIFAEVVARKFLFHQEDVVLSEGDKVRDLLRLDLSQKMPFYAALSFGYSICMAGLLFLILGFASLFINSTILGGLVMVTALWGAIQSLVCFMGLLPMSRFWLPQNLSDLMVRIINFPIFTMDSIMNRNNLISALLRIVVFGVAHLFNILALVLYQPAILLFGDRVVRRVVKKQDFYANYTDWYILIL